MKKRKNLIKKKQEKKKYSGFFSTKGKKKSYENVCVRARYTRRGVVKYLLPRLAETREKEEEEQLKKRERAKFERKRRAFMRSFSLTLVSLFFCSTLTPRTVIISADDINNPKEHTYALCHTILLALHKHLYNSLSLSYNSASF